MPCNLPTTDRHLIIILIEYLWRNVAIKVQFAQDDKIDDLQTILFTKCIQNFTRGNTGVFQSSSFYVRS